MGLAACFSLNSLDILPGNALMTLTPFISCASAVLSIPVGKQRGQHTLPSLPSSPLPLGLELGWAGSGGVVGSGPRKAGACNKSRSSQPDSYSVLSKTNTHGSSAVAPPETSSSPLIHPKCSVLGSEPEDHTYCCGRLQSHDCFCQPFYTANARLVLGPALYSSDQELERARVKKYALAMYTSTTNAAQRLTFVYHW